MSREGKSQRFDRRFAHNRFISWRTAVFVAILTGLAIGLSACGGGSTALGTTTSSATSTKSTVAERSSDPTTSTTLTTSATGSSSFGTAITAKLLKYAECMRSHGVSNYPDPLPAGSAPQGNPDVQNFASNSPRFQAAAQACRKYAVGRPVSTADQAELVAKLLKYAQCMQSHGVPSFPDPSSTGGLTIPNSIDQNSPIFTRADNACSKFLPAGSPTMSPG